MLKEKIAIIVPLYNDWDSYDCLLEDILKFKKEHTDILIDNFVIDDSSSVIPDVYNEEIKEVLRLNTNVGHQRAISVGLSYVVDNYDYDAIIVMDADGEDKVLDIDLFLKAYRNDRTQIIFAERGKRHEGLRFRLFYFIYKIIFHALTGTKINIGHFCIIHINIGKKLVHVSEIWNHLACGVIRSKNKYETVIIERGVRYKGKSKMNFTSLIIHGLSAVSVFMDKVAVRLIIIMGLGVFIAFLGIVVVSFFKLFTDMAIPGWATSAVIGFIIILLQSVLIILFIAFMVLNNKNQKLIIPIRDYKEFLGDIIKVGV